jgi:hypothetical protein
LQVIEPNTIYGAVQALKRRGNIIVKHPRGVDLYYHYYPDEELFCCNVPGYTRSFDYHHFVQYLVNNCNEGVPMYYKS